MHTDIRLNQKPFYIISILILFLATTVPVYLAFHFSKVGLTRYLVLSAIAYLVACSYILAEWLYFQKLKRALVLPIVDGRILSTVNERWTRYGTLSKCLIECKYMGQDYRFVPKTEYRSILVGATIRVLLDVKNPQNSIFIQENRYLKITRSTLKDN